KQESRDRGSLEVRERHVPQLRVDRLEELDELRIGRLHAVETDALVEANEVRRSERTDAVAGVAVDALEDRDARALAVRPADRDHLVRRRHEVEPLEDRADPAEAHVDLFRVERLEPREPLREGGEALRHWGKRSRRASGGV